METSEEYLNPSEAASRLGVSIKALRLYEQRGLISPIRTEAGWRVYGPEEMSRAAEIVSLRGLGFSLAQIARVLQGDPSGLEPALAAHQHVLEARMHQLAGTIEKLRSLQNDIVQGQAPSIGTLTRLLAPGSGVRVAFDLPWPWGGERFALRCGGALNYITGPLGSGKTRLALRLAESLPGAGFLGLDRSADDGAAARTRIEADPALKSRVDRTLVWLVEDGATASGPLIGLLAGLEADGPACIVVDQIEYGLDQATQEALIAHLRRRGGSARPLFVMTRSNVILDLAAIGPDETIIFCPANHSPPMQVAPHPGAPGYEAVASCLASPEVRARTKGVVAMRFAQGLHSSPWLPPTSY